MLGQRVIRLLLAAAIGAAGVAGLVGPAPMAAAQEEPLVFCSDLAFPPMEFIVDGEPVGADIDIGTEVAERLGREVEFSNVGFEGIIAALQGGRCDAIISGMSNTPERAEQVDFVNYLSIGQSFMVRAGNPLGITALEDLCGRTAGAQVGTTNYATLEEASAACEAAGEDPVEIVGFDADTDAALALQADRIDVHVSDSPVVAYYIGQQPGVFAFGGEPFKTVPVAIALRKDSPELRDQIQAAIDEMYADGTMMEILEEWNLTDFALDAVGATPTAATPAATPAEG